MYIRVNAFTMNILKNNEQFSTRRTEEVKVKERQGAMKIFRMLGFWFCL